MHLIYRFRSLIAADTGIYAALDASACNLILFSDVIDVIDI